MTNVGVVLSEVVRNRLVAATEDMANTLIRTAYSPLIFEVRDMCCTIMSATGDMWAETPGVVVFSQGFPQAVRDGIARWRGEFEPGDVLIVNDPFVTGTHISDTNIYVPVFHGGELIGFCGCAAHWADIGGKNPGGWCSDTTDMYQEGIRFRHQKLVAAGVRNDGLWDVIADNVRVPTIVHGDLEAQIAACNYGAKCIQEICDKYGADTVRRSMEHVIQETDRAMREAIAKLPNGESRVSVQMDGDGVNPDGEFKFCLKTTIDGDRVRFSLLGSSPTARGPINLPGVNSRGILIAAVKGLLMPSDPCNEGHSKCIEVELPPASIVNPESPAPTDSYGYAIENLLELAFRSLAPVLPDRCPAGGYQLTGAFLSRTQVGAGKPFIMTEPLHGGNGATNVEDGPTNQLVGNGDLPTSPVEIMETRFPILVECLEFAPEMAGAGKFRGGKGVRKQYRMLEPDCYMALVTENTKDPTGKGLNGGHDAKTGYFVINPGRPEEKVYRRALSSIGPFEKGDTWRVVTGGGGGWGPPTARDPERVLYDVRNGFIDATEAREVHGVEVALRDGVWCIAHLVRNSAA